MNTTIRAAASSSASGRLSSRAHSVQSSSDSASVGASSAARRRKSVSASVSLIGGTGTLARPGAATAPGGHEDRQVGQARHERAHLGSRLGKQMLNVVEQDQQPPTGERSPQARRAEPAFSPRTRRDATSDRRAPGREAARARPRRRHLGTPSETSAAAWSARRVLPVPPGPVSDTRRAPPPTASRRPPMSSASRPRNGVAGHGQVRAIRATSAAGTRSEPSWNTRSGARRSLSRCSPRSVSGASTSAAVARAHQHLPTMPRRGNPRRTMHLHADVARLTQRDLTRVHTHPHSDTRRSQRLLRRGRGGKRVRRPRKRHEERIASRVDLDPAVRSPRLPAHTMMLRKKSPVCLHSELVEKTRRPFDVGEHEGDRAGREILSHSTIIRRAGTRVQSNTGSGYRIAGCTSVRTPDLSRRPPSPSVRSATVGPRSRIGGAGAVEHPVGVFHVVLAGTSISQLRSGAMVNSNAGLPLLPSTATSVVVGKRHYLGDAEPLEAR